jgi:antitoxin component YwqK of YwqJK toxin-antitoxin module
MMNEREMDVLEAEGEVVPPISGEKRFVGQKIDHKMEGVLEHYDENGMLLASQSFEKGVLHGESLRYDTKQRLKEKITFHEGVPHGPAEFYKEGRPLMLTHFQRGKHQGETVHFDETGMIRGRIQYEEGKKYGQSITYDTLGRVKRIVHYQNDLLEGPSLTYYPNGSPLETGMYIQGLREGEFRSFYENGAVRQILTFEKGRLIRKPQFFDAQGTPTSRGIEH